MGDLLWTRQAFKHKAQGETDPSPEGPHDPLWLERISAEVDRDIRVLGH